MFRITSLLLITASIHFAQEGPLQLDRPPNPARRQRPPDRSETVKPTLTLEDAVALAEQHNPRFKAAEASIDGARAGIQTARAFRNPDITVGGFGNQQATQNSAIPGMIQGFSYSQSLDLPSVRRARIDAAELARQTSQFALAETRLAVRAAVKQAFFQVLRRRAEVELSRGNLQLLEDLQRRIGVQVKVGEAARLELVRADAEVATARIQVQSSQLRLTAARSALNAAIGAALDRDIEPQGTLDSIAKLPPLDTLRDEVLARHPTVALASNEARRAGALLNLERALLKPQPTIWADMFRQPDAAQYRMGVTIPVPLWNKREGPIGEAIAVQRHAAAVADQRRLEITAELEQAYGQYEVASQQVAMFEAGTLLEAEAAVTAAEAAFRFGERGIIEVLDAQRILRGARLDYLNAQYDRQSALIEFERLGVVDLKRGTP